METPPAPPMADGRPVFDAALDETPLEATLSAGPAEVRDTIEVVRPKSGTGLWSALRQAVGKDLTRISMPVHFNEPTSFTQRLVEDLEYVHLLDEAAACQDSMRRLALVATFANAMFASSATGMRVYKAFNPLLGETFEMIRPKEGYRVVVEQVSHHPPITAMHAESTKGWKYRQEYSCDVKFRGTLKLFPNGVAIVEFPNGDRFSFTKPTVIVHNVLLGKLWVDQDGTVEVRNHRTNDVCNMIWSPYSAVGGRYMNLSGHVCDSAGKVHYTLHGRWDQGMALLKGEHELSRLPAGDTILKDKAHEVLWRAYPVPADCKAKYGMTAFAMSLNQKEENVCPTDSRLRPDLRMLEDGSFSEASAAKHRLEEKQRAARRERQTAEDEWEPRWFRHVEDEQIGRGYHVYCGGYWDAKAKGSFSDKKKFSDLY